MKRYPLTSEQFGKLKGQDWEIHELAMSEWNKIPGLPRVDGLVAVFYSGSMNMPKILNGIESIVGFDAVAKEDRPKKGEPELNIYHGVVQQLEPAKNGGVPFLLNAPFTEETLFGHWAGYDTLQKYIDAMAQQKKPPE